MHGSIVFTIISHVHNERSHHILLSINSLVNFGAPPAGATPPRDPREVLPRAPREAHPSLPRALRPAPKT